MTRRELVFSAGALWLVQSKAAELTEEVERILSRIRPPEFPPRDFDIRQYGATPGGNELCTDAISKAVDACNKAGGGRVVVPSGVFLTGAIHLKSRVNLFLSEGSTLKFSTDPKHYLPLVFTRFESTECMNFSPFVYAFEEEDIGISGPGTLDGQADAQHWWPWKKSSDAEGDRQKLVAMGNRNLPVTERVFGDGHTLRPNFIQPYRCRNVLFEGFRVVNSPMWELNPVLCRNVTIRGVRIDSHGPNNDGCDPECCTDVLVEKCTFSTGDDCIAIKSGRNQDGRRVNTPCHNVIIRDCEMQDGHGGVSIGSEVSGGIKNVYIDNCRMNSPRLERGLRIKTNSYRGGAIENIHFTNVTIGQVAQAAVEVDFYYEEGAGGPFPPSVKDIFIEKVTSRRSKYGVYFRGYANAPINGVHISHCRFDNAAQGNVLQNIIDLKTDDVLVNGRELG